MERKRNAGKAVPDFAALHPGYATLHPFSIPEHPLIYIAKT
jgi:hypothetical protein